MIFVFGSVNIDMVIPVAGVPKPGETLIGGDVSFLPGGKGANQALAARKDGSEVVMLASVGNDSFADVALDSLEKAGVNTDHVKKSDAYTGVAAISVAQTGENIIVLSPGANNKLSVSDFDPAIFSDCRVLITQNEVPFAQTNRVLKLAKQNDLTTIHNAAPALEMSKAELANVDFLVVNEIECEEIARSLGVGSDDIGQMAADISLIGDTDCIVTLGKDGAIGSRNGQNQYFKAPSIKAKDTTGAGDTFVGVFASEIAKGHDMSRAIQRGVAAGSLACLKFGAQSGMPTHEEIDEAFEKI